MESVPSQSQKQTCCGRTLLDASDRLALVRREALLDEIGGFLGRFEAQILQKTSANDTHYAAVKNRDLISK